MLVEAVCSLSIDAAKTEWMKSRTRVRLWRRHVSVQAWMLSRETILQGFAR